MRFRFPIVLVSLLAIAACDANQSPTSSSVPGSGSGSTGTNTTPGSMTATIDGTQWTATLPIGVKGPVAPGLPNGSLAVSGTGVVANQNLRLAFEVPATAGTYALGTGDIPLAQNASLQNTSLGTSWTANTFNGGGSITVTSITLIGASGTFDFTLAPAGSTATGTRVITQGVFNLTF